MDMFEQTQGDDEGQGSLVCCSPQGCSQPLLSNRTTAQLTALPTVFPAHTTTCLVRSSTWSTSARSVHLAFKDSVHLQGTEVSSSQGLHCLG